MNVNPPLIFSLSLTKTSKVTESPLKRTEKPKVKTTMLRV